MDTTITIIESYLVGSLIAVFVVIVMQFFQRVAVELFHRRIVLPFYDYTTENIIGLGLMSWVGLVPELIDIAKYFIGKIKRRNDGKRRRI